MKPKLCIVCGKEVTYSLRKGRCSWCDKKARNDDPDGTLHNARNASYRKKNPGMASRIHLLKRYGLTPEMFEAKKTKQYNKCQICLKEFTETPRVDHDHSSETMKVRGLLCGNCNSGIGMLLDNEFILSRAIAYLKHYGAISEDWSETQFVDLRPKHD